MCLAKTKYDSVTQYLVELIREQQLLEWRTESAQVGSPQTKGKILAITSILVRKLERRGVDTRHVSVLAIVNFFREN